MLESFTRWIAKPFSLDMSALQWFFFYGLILVIAVSWGLILRTMRSVSS